jgi:flagella basal body P-ring formation protein FlgA
MKCCSRSISSRGSARLVTAAVLLLAWAAGAAADDAAVRAAIVQAVQARMGAAADVRIADLRVDMSADGTSLTARPEPGSRSGGPVRFALIAPRVDGKPGARRVGSAVATVHVSVAHARAARDVPRGTTVGAGDLIESRDDIGVMPLAAPLTVQDAAGGRAARDLSPGEILTPALVHPQPLVRSGDEVVVTVVMGGLVVSGMAIAQQSGRRNDRIKLINPDSRRTLVGRVTAPGRVEVIHGS